LVEIAPRTVRVIYNPFDIASIERAARENPFHKWLEPGQPPVIIAVGRLSIEKDFHTLIDAFVKIRRSRIARLLILGDGPLRSQLVSYAVHRGLNKDDFMLVGYKPNPFAYMSRSRVLVLSSCLEGFGNVLVEAMACGVPVVSTDCIGAPREILEDGKWGKLVPVGDSDALSVAVEGVMRASSRDLPNYQERAKEFDIKYAVDAYLDLFKPPTGAADE
jgi:glycosyltransferase involved in cell wall biosynthesis